MRHTIISLSLLISLSACGAETLSQRPQNPRPLPPPDTFAIRDATRQTLLNDFAPLDVTRGVDLPFRSNLQYRGLMNTTLGPQQAAIGNVIIDVDTVRDTVSGSATNFIDRNNRNMRGALEIFRGTFDERPFGGDYQAIAGVRGTLTDAVRRNYAISGQLEGDLLGRNAEAFEGILSGAVKVNGRAQDPIKGGVVAERVR